MGRPRKFDEDTAVDNLVLLFWRRGYDRVNQQQMAEATGLSTSSLYSTFGTKAQTFERVLRRYFELADELMQPLRCGQAGIADLLEFVNRLRAQLDGCLGADGCLVGTSMTALAGCDDAARNLMVEHIRGRRDAFRCALQRARDFDEPVPEPASTAAVLLAAVIGIFATARATAAGPEAYEQLAGLESLIASWCR